MVPLVRLEPLAPDHAPDRAAAAEEDRGAYAFTAVPHANEMQQYLAAHAERMASGMLAPFAQIRRRDGRAVGVTASPPLASPVFSLGYEGRAVCLT